MSSGIAKQIEKSTNQPGVKDSKITCEACSGGSADRALLAKLKCFAPSALLKRTLETYRCHKVLNAMCVVLQMAASA